MHIVVILMILLYSISNHLCYSGDVTGGMHRNMYDQLFFLMDATYKMNKYDPPLLQVVTLTKRALGTCQNTFLFIDVHVLVISPVLCKL